MRCWSSFGRALGFAVAAAATLLVAEPLMAPVFGARALLRGFAVGVAAVYVMGLGPRWRRGLASAAVAAGLGAVLLVLPLSVSSTVAGMAGVVALCRSGIVYRQRPLRALAAEALLLAGGLALASFLAGGGPVSWALATWGYFLVQSAFFLIGGVRVRREAPSEDPFERARAELLALLE